MFANAMILSMNMVAFPGNFPTEEIVASCQPTLDSISVGMEEQSVRRRHPSSECFEREERLVVEHGTPPLFRSNPSLPITTKPQVHHMVTFTDIPALLRLAGLEPRRSEPPPI